VSGVKRKEKQAPQGAPQDPHELAETFGDARDG